MTHATSFGSVTSLLRSHPNQQKLKSTLSCLLIFLSCNMAVVQLSSVRCSVYILARCFVCELNCSFSVCTSALPRQHFIALKEG